MLATKSIDIRDNFKFWCDKVTRGETVLVIRPKNENIYMINEAEYNELQKAKRNAEYLSKIDSSIAAHEKGDTIRFTLEELQEMEADDWKPTQKVIDFEEDHGIKRGNF